MCCRLHVSKNSCFRLLPFNNARNSDCYSVFVLSSSELQGQDDYIIRIEKCCACARVCLSALVLLCVMCHTHVCVFISIVVSLFYGVFCSACTTPGARCHKARVCACVFVCCMCVFSFVL